jgi:dihydrofolate synthase/folylpolyglutamate synthase
VDHIILVTPPTAPASRAWSVDEAYQYAQENGIAARIDRDFANAVKGSVYDAGTSVITGSFHTVGDALELLGEKAF